MFFYGSKYFPFDVIHSFSFSTLAQNLHWLEGSGCVNAVTFCFIFFTSRAQNEYRINHPDRMKSIENKRKIKHVKGGVEQNRKPEAPAVSQRDE